MTTGFQQQAPLGTFTILKSAASQQNGQRSEPTRLQPEPAPPPRSFKPRSFKPRPGLT